MSSEDVSDFHKEIIEGLATLRQVTNDTLAQTIKTNGRVTKLEDAVSFNTTRISLLEAGRAEAVMRSGWWKDKMGTAFIGLAFTTIGATLILILQKTDILDVSVVSADQYNSLP